MSASADPKGTIERTRVEGTAQERAQALHDLSIAHAELGHLDEAAELAARGLELNVEPQRFHLTLAWLDLDRGNTAQSLEHLDEAMPKLNGRDLARARVLRGLHLCQSAEPRLAIAELSAVIRELRRHRDDRWLANALIGRGIARAYALRLAEADSDFSGAHTLLTALGEHGRAAMCLHNKGFVAMLAGQLPRALGCYEDAARAGLDSASRPEALIDRAEALLAAGLTEDADRVLRPALDMLQRCKRGSRLPEAVLLAGQCALTQHNFDEAAQRAQQAESLFRSQGRTTWVPAARALAVHARRARGVDVRDEAKALAERCRAADAAELLIAAEEWEAVAAKRFKGTAHIRALGWLAKAMSSDKREALQACRAGLKVIEEHRAALTTTWPGTALTSRALDLATTPAEVLRWAERHRAHQLAYAELHPPADPELATALSALRRARVHDEPTEALERDIRRRILATATKFPATRMQLPERLVSFTLHRGQLRVVTKTGGRTRLTTIPDPREEVEAIRLAIRAGRPAPQLDLLPGDDFVVVPDGALTRMPWSALGRRVTLTPSLEHWSRTREAGEGTAWISGPGLADAHREVQALQEEHGGEILRNSTVEEAIRAMDGKRLVHIAAHGRVREDHPLFSSLHLADGPLHGYDLERLHRAPEIVVLSACDSGLARALLDAGARVVIASVMPVPDERTTRLMTVLHRELRTSTPAQAVLTAQQRAGHLGFNCYGG